MVRKMKKKIGLDLGTGKCCVAIANDGKVTVLPDARGDKTTPSFVAFNEYRTLAGSDARDQANINATNTAYGIKTILGRTLEDPVVVRKLDSEYNVALPFPSYEAGEDGVPEFKFEYKNEKLSLRPEQITALLIGKMKSIAEKYLENEVNGAVISVPVSFNTAQRQATLDAARIAGFKDSTLVNCTTAAAVAYWDHTLRKDDCIAVVDIGAGSVNFAIVSIKSGNIKVEDAYGDCEKGGIDIDLCMMSALIQKFNKENSGEFKRSTKALMRLRRATESLKHTLSLLPTGKIQEDAFSVEDYTSMTLTRQEMVESCKEVLAVVSAGLSRLKSSKLWDEVRCAVVVGGSTRIPAVQHMISSKLNKPVDQSLNKDEAIACGAALLGSGSTSPPEVVDVLGRRIWCESTAEDSIVFDFWTPVPEEKEFELSPFGGMKVWENLESVGSKKYNVFELCSLATTEKKQLYYQGGLIFSVGDSGIFRAEIVSNGKCVDIALNIPSLKASALSDSIETHGRFSREEEQLEENENAMNDLESFCFEQRQIVEEELDGNVELVQFLDDVLQWLECTPYATKTECDSKKSEIGSKVNASKQQANARQEDAHHPSREIETMKVITSQTGSAGRGHTSAYMKSVHENNGKSHKEITDSKSSKGIAADSDDQKENFGDNSNLSGLSDPRSKLPDEKRSQRTKIFKNSSQIYSSCKPLVANGIHGRKTSNARSSWEQRPNVVHQHAPHPRLHSGKSSSVETETCRLPPVNVSRSSGGRSPNYLTGDSKIGSTSRCSRSASSSKNQCRHQHHGHRSKSQKEDASNIIAAVKSRNKRTILKPESRSESSPSKVHSRVYTNNAKPRRSQAASSSARGRPGSSDYAKSQVSSPSSWSSKKAFPGKVVRVQNLSPSAQTKPSSTKEGFGTGRHTATRAASRKSGDQGAEVRVARREEKYGIRSPHAVGTQSSKGSKREKTSKEKIGCFQGFFSRH